MTVITLNQPIEFVVEECYKCGVLFGMTKPIYRQAHEQGMEFFCPNGHGQVYRMSDVNRLKVELKHVQETLLIERNTHMDTKFKLSSTETKLKRARKRIANGTCLCCHRQFTQLARHMKSKHPEFQP